MPASDNTATTNLLLTLMARYRMRHNSFWSFLQMRTLRNFLICTCLLFLSCLLFTYVVYLNSNWIYYYFKLILPDDEENETVKKNYSPKFYPGKVQSITFDQRIKYNDFNFLDRSTLNYSSRTYSNGITILYRLPRLKKPSALLLIFHGCSRTALNWFHTEERQRIVGAAVDLGYGCLAFQATDTHSRCWSSTGDLFDNDDVQMVLKGLEEFYKEHGDLARLPRYTFGASSGGMFSSLFVLNDRYKVSGQILFISIIHPQVMFLIRSNNYPPTAFIHMLRDIEFASEERIQMSTQTFKSQNIPYKMFPVEPIVVRTSTFHNRIPSIPLEVSNYLYYKLQQNKWLDDDGYMIHNPRRVKTWQRFLYETKQKLILDRLFTFNDTLPDFLNTIYGEHEISYERSFEALKWLKSLNEQPENKVEKQKKKI